MSDAIDVSLIGSVLRGSRWRPLAVSCVVGTAVILVPLLLGVRLEYLDVTLTIHLAMFITLTGPCFVLDDPALSMTRVLPFSAARTAFVRMGVAVGLLTPVWVLQLACAPHLVTSSMPYRGWLLAIELYGVLVWVWVLAWWRVGRHAAGPDGAAGAAVAVPALLIGAVLLALLPEPVALLVNPGSPETTGSRLRWLVVLLAGAATLAWLLTDPLRRPRLRG